MSTTDKEKFNSEPNFIRSGLYYMKYFENTRKQSFSQKYFASEALKNSGNYFYKKGNLEKAIIEYEKVKEKIISN
jgi:hypothetical protein